MSVDGTVILLDAGQEYHHENGTVTFEVVDDDTDTTIVTEVDAGSFRLVLEPNVTLS